MTDKYLFLQLTILLGLSQLYHENISFIISLNEGFQEYTKKNKSTYHFLIFVIICIRLNECQGYFKNIKSTDYMTQTDCHKMMKKDETNKMYMTEKMDKTRTLEYYFCVIPSHHKIDMT